MIVITRHPLLTTAFCLLFLVITSCSGGQVPPVSEQSVPDSQAIVPTEPAAPEEPTPIQELPADKSETGLAQVDRLDIAILESFPVQVNAIIQGTLPDGCTTIDQVMQEQQGSSFTITLITTRPANAVCTAEAVPFEEVVSLEVANLPAGTYTVEANGVGNTFDLAVDNSPPAEAAAGEMITGQAAVERVGVLVLESLEVEANVVVEGNLPDGCTELGEVTQTQQGKTIQVNIATVRPADAICTQALVPFSEVIPLDIAGLEPGRYTINVNGVRSTFELAADTAPAEPTAPATTDWVRVTPAGAGLSFEVPADWQQTGLEWSPAAENEARIGFNWMETGPDWDPLAMLPPDSTPRGEFPLELSWANATLYQLEIKDDTGQIIAVEGHIIGPLDQPVAYDLYARGRTVEELTTVAEAHRHMIESAELVASIPEELPASCIPGPEQRRHLEAAGRYCLLYPADITPAAPPGRLSLTGPARSGEPEPVAANLTITVSALENDRTLAELVTETVEPHQDLAITTAATTLGGEPAEVIEGLPGRVGNRQLFAIRDGTVFHLVLTPVDEALPEAAADAEVLWQMVTDSFTFLP